MNTADIPRTTIEPTSGRCIHVYHSDRPDRPVPGMVIFPIDDQGVHRQVLARVFGEFVDSRERIMIFDPLVPEQRNLLAHATPGLVWAEWMPYQKGQAQKTEQVSESLIPRVAAIEEELDALKRTVGIRISDEDGGSEAEQTKPIDEDSPAESESP